MKKSILFLTITFFLAYSNLSAQLKITQSSIEEFSTLGDSKEVSKLEKKWKAALKGQMQMNFLARNESTLLFSVDLGTAALEKPIIMTNNDGSVFTKALEGGTFYQYLYSYDAKTMRLKSARHADLKNLSITNTYPLEPVLLNNGNVTYFFNKLNKEGKEVTSSFAYAINDGEIIDLEKSEMVFANMRESSIYDKYVICSENNKFYAIITSEDGIKANARVYNDKFEFQYKTLVDLPEIETKTKSLMNLTSKLLKYKSILSNDGQTIHFHRIDIKKKEQKINFELLTYNKATDKLTTIVKRFEAFDFFVQKGREPIYAMYFKNDYFYLTGVSPKAERGDEKYKNQVGYFLLHKISLSDLEIIKSYKTAFDDALITDFKELTSSFFGNRQFDKSTTDVKYIDWIFNEQQTEIAAINLRYYNISNTIGLGSGVQVNVIPVGDIYLSAKDDFKNPIIAQPSNGDDNKEYNFAFNDKVYKFESSKDKLELYEVKGKKDKTLVKEFNVSGRIIFKKKIIEGTDYITFKTSEGLVRLDF